MTASPHERRQNEELLARLTAADDLCDAGKGEEAIAIYDELERASSHPTDVAQLRLKKVIALTNMGNLARAEQLIDTVDPEVLSEEYRLLYRFEIGRIKAALGKPDEAIVVLTQAIRDADNVEIGDALHAVRQAMIIVLGSLLCESGQPERAIPWLQRIRYGAQGWEKAQRVLGDCYVRLGKNKQAIDSYHELLKATNALSELERDMALRNLGAAYYYSRDFRNASKCLAAALPKFDGFPEIQCEIENMLKKCK